MIHAKKSFLRIIADTKNTDVIYNYLETIIRPPYDYSDLLRWQWVQAVSALDKFIHDLIRIGMHEVSVNSRDATSKYNSFVIDMHSYNEIKQDPTVEWQVMERQLNLKLGYMSFQDPSKVADGLSYIWNV